MSKARYRGDDPTANEAVARADRSARNMGGKASRDKGKHGEREFAAVCRAHGYDAKRGQQYSGLGGEDVVGLPGVHVEVKRVNALRLYDAMEQSKRDAKPGCVPIVAHRKDRGEWLIIMRACDWFEMYRQGAGNIVRHENREDGSDE